MINIQDGCYRSHDHLICINQKQMQYSSCLLSKLSEYQGHPTYLLYKIFVIHPFSSWLADPVCISVLAGKFYQLVANVGHSKILYCLFPPPFFLTWVALKLELRVMFDILCVQLLINFYDLNIELHKHWIMLMFHIIVFK